MPKVPKQSAVKRQKLPGASELPPPGSVLTARALAEAARRLWEEGRRIVWTNGCFDILHVGHLLLLERARALGDVLVVGVNSDASVRKRKGKNRPVNPLRDRLRLLAALRPVDYVASFRSARPLALLHAVRPHIYAKGDDYTLETIDQEERRIVEAGGGRAVFVGLAPGRSTTNLVRKIRAR